MSVEVHSLGCRLNLAESEAMRALLADSPDPLVVVNSCAVTNEAVRRTRQTIRRVRAERPEARLLVTGCAAETERDALSRMAEVDGLVANAAKLDPRAWNVAPPLPAQAPAPAAAIPRLAARERHTRGFVAVQTGCDHACTFCIIPQGRGASRSRPVADVLREIEGQLESGVREVVLTGVDLTSWGADLPASPRLGELCRAILARFAALGRLRLSSVDGAEVDPLLFDLLAGEPRLMPHLHLSLQHGHDLVLKRMKRRHTRGQAIALVESLRARRADLAIGADLIAGFPTEDEEMHAANLSIVRDIGIVHGHVFPYSARTGTPAARMPQVPGALIRARAAELRAAVARERTRWLGSLVGRELEVLAERGGTGHAPGFAPVRLPDGTEPGTLLRIVPERLDEGLLAA